MRHRWWHDAITGQFYAVATNERGEIVSAWMQVDRRVNRWEAIDELDGFGPLERARKRGEIHVNTDPHGYTDELGPSIEEPVQ